MATTVVCFHCSPEELARTIWEGDEDVTLECPPERLHTPSEAENWPDSWIQTSEVPTQVPMAPQLPAVLWAYSLLQSFPKPLSGWASCCYFAFAAFLGLYQQVGFTMTSMILVP